MLHIPRAVPFQMMSKGIPTIPNGNLETALPSKKAEARALIRVPYCCNFQKIALLELPD